MTDMTNVIDTVFQQPAAKTEVSEINVRDMYWGYVVEKEDGSQLSTVILQLVAMLLGAGCFAASIGLTVFSVGPVDLMSRGAVAAFFFGLSVCLLWFASRVITSELHIDRSQAEVREIVHGYTGRSTVAGRFNFDSIGGVFLDRTHSPAGRAVLTLRYRETAQTVPLMSGDVVTLTPLCARIYEDLLAGVEPQFETQEILDIAV